MQRRTAWSIVNKYLEILFTTADYLITYLFSKYFLIATENPTSLLQQKQHAKDRHADFDHIQLGVKL